MVRLLFSVFDRVAEVYAAPFVEVTRGAAARAFGDAVTSPQNSQKAHCEDFDLYEVGTFDDASCVITCVEKRIVARGQDYKV